jgi:hypothetical protein
VIVNEHIDVFAMASVTEHVTMFTPTAKNDPDAGEHTGAPTPGQLSETTGAAKVTIAPGVVPIIVDAGTAMFAGQVIDGAWVSLTVTVKVQVPVFAEASVAVHVTVVVPFGNVEPEAGTHATVAPGQLSEAVGVV